jgi:uncharacterized protein (DUF1778 family)
MFMRRNERGQILPEGDRPKLKQICFRCDDETFEQIKNSARNAGKTISEFVSDAVAKEMGSTFAKKTLASPDTNEDKQSIAKLSDESLISSSLGHTALAKLLGVHPETIRRYANGKRHPPADFEWEWRDGKWHQKEVFSR